MNLGKQQLIFIESRLTYVFLCKLLIMCENAARSQRIIAKLQINKEKSGLDSPGNS